MKSNPLLRATLASASLTAAMMAQAVTATATAGTTMSVSCSGCATQDIPVGTNLTLGGSVSTQGTSSIGFASAATVFLPLAITNYELLATLNTAVTATATRSFSRIQAACGVFWVSPLPARNDVLLHLHATEPVRGRFVVTHARQVTRLCDLVYWLDVGDDGQLEASNALITRPLLPVAFGPGSLPVRLSNYAGYSLTDEQWHFAGASQLAIHFVPDSGCVPTIVAPPCGSIDLQPTQNFTLGTDQVVTGLQPAGQGLAAVVYGFQSTQMPLPNSAGCMLTNDAFAVRLLAADATGRAVHAIHTIPVALRPLAILAQVIELDVAQGTVSTSASHRIDCN